MKRYIRLLNVTLICTTDMNRLLIFFTLCLAAHFACAQNEGNIWYFGDFAGIDFNQNPPVALTNSAMSQGEGVASIADRVTGALLFLYRWAIHLECEPSNHAKWYRSFG